VPGVRVLVKDEHIRIKLLPQETKYLYYESKQSTYTKISIDFDLETEKPNESVKIVEKKGTHGVTYLPTIETNDKVKSFTSSKPISFEFETEGYDLVLFGIVNLNEFPVY
jgi:hypothetical protein